MKRIYIKYTYHIILKIYNRINSFQYLFEPFRKKIKNVEIGSGSSRKKGWFSIDYRFGSDLTFDIRKKLPIPNEQCDIVYAEHVLEHFGLDDLHRVFLSVKLVLRPNGRFLISVPNLKIFVNAYNSKAASGTLLKYRPAILSERPADILNYIFYMAGEHKMMFDFDSLSFHLSRAGFRNIKERHFDPLLDSLGRKDESLLVECVK